ncbi:hypothetical protein TVAG_007310 [Trichomonas vaginalis G3]|uniref:Uncharacterized protein n=1 Tax=Trichomonas vaginalis (strain ATCC PRA-98 / G3) TaxID=412133 RepID=A2F4J2_TRIV3|nr:hypothetical protein TVAGG3_0422190 [Trichomonas vaginalis G3]EAY00201.1 hypothetical protein TVAG_007310 [Trichomonas vaginalis G3]KAI5536153.1 hypothetical protein TVAGG3_0422190 [Trichomonas vaginalis G3]|eukprot:XP_001313130.1 hypothetical protein [Trichomonas vaginalis G3]
MKINAKKIDKKLIDYIKEHPYLDDLIKNVQSGHILMKFPIYDISNIDELFYSPSMFISSHYNILFTNCIQNKHMTLINPKFDPKKSKTVLSKLKESSKMCNLSESKACHYLTILDSLRMFNNSKHEMIDKETTTTFKEYVYESNNSQNSKDYIAVETQKSEKHVQQENRETQTDINERVDQLTDPLEMQDSKSSEEIEKYKNAYLECQNQLKNLQTNSDKLQYNYELLLKVLDTIKIEEISGEDISLDSLLEMPNVS